MTLHLALFLAEGQISLLSVAENTTTCLSEESALKNCCTPSHVYIIYITVNDNFIKINLWTRSWQINNQENRWLLNLQRFLYQSSRQRVSLPHSTGMNCKVHQSNKCKQLHQLQHSNLCALQRREPKLQLNLLYKVHLWGQNSKQHLVFSSISTSCFWSEEQDHFTSFTKTLNQCSTCNHSSLNTCLSHFSKHFERRINLSL